MSPVPSFAHTSTDIVTGFCVVTAVLAALAAKDLFTFRQSGKIAPLKK